MEKALDSAVPPCGGCYIIPEKYARAIAELRHHDDNEFVVHLLQDGTAKGITLDSGRLRAELTRAAAEAKRQPGVPK
ncbi:MAG TPA: hypothetical protein VKP66_19570 [Steroidobacteraceae bacterium]|nr:hypothetical protein [Steroidobacteraceae bacterium]